MISPTGWVYTACLTVLTVYNRARNWSKGSEIIAKVPDFHGFRSKSHTRTDRSEIWYGEAHFRSL